MLVARIALPSLSAPTHYLFIFLHFYGSDYH